jgi:hypothetical protein
VILTPERVCPLLLALLRATDVVPKKRLEAPSTSAGIVPDSLVESSVEAEVSTAVSRDQVLAAVFFKKPVVAAIAAIAAKSASYACTLVSITRPSVERILDELVLPSNVRAKLEMSVTSEVPDPVKYGSLLAALVRPAIAVRLVLLG